MEISIIIVSWNVRELLERCLASIFRYTTGVSFEVIVIDNNSSDGTVSMIKEKFPQVKLIANNHNAGFAKANNQGMRAASGAYLFFLNPDTELLEDSASILLAEFSEHPKAAVVTGGLLYPDMSRQSNVKHDPGVLDQIWIALKLHHLILIPSLRRYLAKEFCYEDEQFVEQVMGASLCVRSAVMRELGGWDEDFWLWWEDVELCRRVRDAGYEILYTPKTRIIHHEGKSFAQQPSYKKQKRFMKGMALYFKKHGSWWQYCVVLCLTPCSLLLAALVQALHIAPSTQSKL